jgi:CMP/dCMP kinase
LILAQHELIVQDLSVPVITIDGGNGTGKGTARRNVARELGFLEFDSGVLYRTLGVQSYERKVLHDIAALVAIASNLNVQTEGEVVIVDGVDQTKLIRSEEAGKLAAIVARVPEVRNAFHVYQLGLRKPPGLVADGRDMGFIYDTPHRFFLITDPEERAARRYKQFQRLELEADYEQILQNIVERDESDRNNPANHLRPHPEAKIINNTNLMPEETKTLILNIYKGLVCT